MSAKYTLVGILALLPLVPATSQFSQLLAQPVAPAESMSSRVPPPVSESVAGTMEIDAEALELRDPFRRPFVVSAAPGTPVGELESFSVDEFKMVGSIVGTDRVRAILIDPKGKTHIVSERMKIGLKQGVIREIRTSYVKVREKVINAIGREELVETDIKLISKNQSGQAAGGGY